MIEGVNSVIANASSVRGVAEQTSTARAFAANPERAQEVAKAPYVSPYIRVDVNFDKAVLQIRDSDTGDVVRQFPSESQLQAYRRAQAAQAQSESLEEVRISTASETPRETPEVSTPQPRVQEPAQTQVRVVPAPAQEAASPIDTEV